MKNIPVPPPADYGMVAVRDLVNKTTATFHEGSAPELSGDGQYVFYQFNNAIHRRTLTNANAGDVPAPDGGCVLESTTLSASYNGGRVAFSCVNPNGPGSTEQYAWVYQFSPARIFSVRVPGQAVDQTVISGDGKRVIFIGSNTDIGSYLYAWDVDNTAGPVVISTNGSLGISDWSNISISKNGAFVANSPSSGFSTKVNRLKLQGTGASITVAGAIDVDVLSNGLPAAGSSDQPSISADGQTVAFSSDKRLHERDYERPNDDDIYARTEPG